ncbi:CPBP family intramembrane glutamic endopeptidase [Faecalispora anaeroviscerum]|uniref:CPBP family intramembrane glutamic endopeptidase n=1 Tax=Faecalispora anaeroviscerum TaxID=2991836 RepID=UPI0024BB0827|nr:type II CAAX endopeptidase family protein [Faecalispora anaeroviscerum]
MKQQATGFPTDFGRYSAGQEKKALRWEANRLCVVLIAIQALVAILSVLSRLYLRQLNLMGYSLDAFQGIPPILYFLSYASVYLVGLTLPVFFYWGIRHISPVRALRFEPVRPATVFWMVLFGVGICTTANIPSNMVVTFFKSMGYSGKVPDLPLNEDPFVQALFFVTLAIIPPITEELIFRGAILSGLRQFGDAAAIFGSAFLFALYHGNFAQMVFAFPCGLVLAFVVIKTGNLWVSILIHFINNGTSVLFQLSQFYTNEATASAAYTVYFISSALAGVGALIFLSRRDKNLFRLDDHNSVLTTAQKFVTTLWNPGAVALILLSLVSAVYVLETY